jgi:hypothetical protein
MASKTLEPGGRSAVSVRPLLLDICETESCER